MTGRLTYTDLLQTVSEQTGASKQQVLELMRGVVQAIRFGLERDGHVAIRGLGRFELRWQEIRNGRNPQTGEELTIPGHNRVHFKPESGLRRFINRKYGHLKPKMLSAEKSDDNVPPITVHPPTEEDGSLVRDNSSHEKRSMRWLWSIPIVVVIILVIMLWPRIRSAFTTNKKTDTASIAQAEPGDDPSSTSSTGIPGTDHRVQQGDRMWTLSDRYYGNAYLWPHIFRTNMVSITNPDIIYIGKTIKIPPLEGRPEQLSANDRTCIADGYMRVYLVYRRMGKPRPFTYLWVARQTGGPSLWEAYQERIDEEDIARASEMKGKNLIR